MSPPQIGKVLDEFPGGNRMKALLLGIFMPAILAVALVAMSPSRAATLTVDTTVDDPAATACTDATPNDCSLRGAIIKANGLSEASTILVPAGTYVLSQSTSCTFRTHQFGDFDVNTTALCIGADVTLIGVGAASTIIDGKTGEMINLMNDQKAAVRVSAEKMKAAAEIAAVQDHLKLLKAMGSTTIEIIIRSMNAVR